MKYNILLLSFFLLTTNGNAMDTEYGLSNVSHFISKEKGEFAAQEVFKRGADCNELLISIRTQLEVTVPLHNIPEAHTQFHSFVYGIVWALKKRNLTFTRQQYTEHIVNQTGSDKDPQTQKSRKELVELLTADLTRAEMLT
ncbi:MAG: hypothetical protein AB7F19_01970 [Candidatus Babeliales bacterium]